MEDISRELERELKTDFKPVPYKKSCKKRIIIIDDFGERSSGEWLKVSNWFLLGISIIFISLTAVFYYLYSELNVKNIEYKEKIATAEKRVDFLTDEKEVLMAKLVIFGKKPEFVVSQNNEIIKPTGPIKKDDKPFDKKEETVPIKSESKQVPVIEEKTIPEIPSLEKQSPDSMELTPVGPDDKNQKTVNIEKFQVMRDGQNGDLLVRFDIRNISEQPGDVAGYIFTVLRTESDDAENWLVVPSTTLENGIPQIYKKGQYFSIAHFKPVKFRIKKQSSPDEFTKASIFVFNNMGDLIFSNVIDITEDEKV